MLYVFQVDTGKMTTFEMSLTMGSVENLKIHIERVCKIPIEQQVLLVSGGLTLNPDTKVGSYGAGTDTNPIFLFSKAIQNSSPPEQRYCGPAFDMSEKVKEASDLPSNYNTVVKRTQLAQEFYDLALAEKNFLECLVNEQHIQHQGWMTVVANLDDLADDLQKRFDLFKNEFNGYLNKRNEYLDLLNSFQSDLQMLRKVPLLPALYSADDEVKFVPDDNVEPEGDFKYSLFDWVTKDQKHCITKLYQLCTEGYEMLISGIELRLEVEVTKIIEEVRRKERKEIKGLQQRLYDLGTIMKNVEAIVTEQKELALSFARNQTRANNLREQSIMPDLCATHLHQLKVLLENHDRIRNYSLKVINAKKELHSNIHCRLQWVIAMESDILEIDNTIVNTFNKVLKIRDSFISLDQIHHAAEMYLQAIGEIVRRRKFSQSFLVWASEFACHMLTIYNDELSRRKEFQSQFGQHFLKPIFPGLDDLPVPFATQTPSIFDSRLPHLVEDDVKKLKTVLPELAPYLNVPDVTPVVNFFLSHSVIKEDDRNDDNAPIEEKLIEVVKEAGVASNLDQTVLKAIENEPPLTTPHVLPHLKDLDRGCESETDTEEFEKVGQSPFELNFDKGLPSPKPGTQDVSTITEVGVVYPPPKKPPRAFQQKSLQESSSTCGSTINPQNIITNSCNNTTLQLQRTLSTSGSQSNTESFTNIKNPSLESIDELSSIKNFGSNIIVDSCYNSHHQQQMLHGLTSSATTSLLLRSKSISPHTPQSPKDLLQTMDSPNSPPLLMGHQQQQQLPQHNDFVSDEFYIDESLPSSLSIETGQSQGEFVKQLDTANNVVALLQDNLQISRSEYEKLKSTLINLMNIAKQVHSEIKSELYNIKTDYTNDKNVLIDNFQSLSTSWSRYITERDNKERETVQQLTVDHELEISDFRRIGQSKNEEIKMLKAQNEDLRQKLIKISEENVEIRKQIQEITREQQIIIENFKMKLDEAHIDKDKCIKEVTDRLKMEHRGEIENIRARFKLMTMERSPSENSLEKIERSDLSSLTNHEALLLQMTENFESEKEVAISDAVAKEADKWKQKLDNIIDDMKKKFFDEKQLLMEDVEKRIVEDKDKQIEILREQMRNMSLECIKYKGTIQQLTEHSEESLNYQLSQKVEELQKTIVTLEADLEKCHGGKSSDMAVSIAVCEGKVDAITSPIKVKRRSDSTRFEKFVFQSCRQGDLVLIVWDTNYKNFKVLQDSNCVHFLHFDSLDGLGLKVIDDQPNRTYCYAEVEGKEHCQAKKDEYSSFDLQQNNRFRVPKGTKFFRVRCKPSTTIKEPPVTIVPMSTLSRQHSQPQPSTSSSSTTTGVIMEEEHLPQMSQSLNNKTTTSSIIATSSGGMIESSPSLSLPSSPSKIHQHTWHGRDIIATPCDIPEEKGEESSVGTTTEQSTTENVACEQETHEEDIEKGTELTENYQIHASIDRSQICIIA